MNVQQTDIKKVKKKPVICQKNEGKNAKNDVQS
jgi:hypothetical protein